MPCCVHFSSLFIFNLVIEIFALDLFCPTFVFVFVFSANARKRRADNKTRNFFMNDETIKVPDNARVRGIVVVMEGEDSASKARDRRTDAVLDQTRPRARRGAGAQAEGEAGGRGKYRTGKRI